MNDEDTEDDVYGYYEYSYFAGLCTCDHRVGQHTWGHCDIDGCKCEAGWEE